MYKRCSNAKGELKEDIKLKTQRYANREMIYMTEDYPDIELNVQPHEIMEKLCSLVDSIGARGAAVESV